MTEPTIIRIRGGLPNQSDHVRLLGETFRRLPGEMDAELESFVIGAVWSRGAAFADRGGLPDADWD